jgi:hypothetical protein
MSNLPVGNPETFLGEIEEMDLSDLYDKQFGVAVSSGKRDGVKFVCSTLRCPLDFYEMVEQVAMVYQEQQVHAKAFILNKDPQKKTKYLDECTIDYLEARSMDIIADGLLSGALTEEKEYTCRAGFFEEEDSDAKPEG